MHVLGFPFVAEVGLGVRIIRRLEDALDSRTAELIALRKAAVEHAAASPIKSAPLQSALGAWASGPSPLGCAPVHVLTGLKGRQNIRAVATRRQPWDCFLPSREPYQEPPDVGNFFNLMRKLLNVI